jgi:hypothetical protein
MTELAVTTKSRRTSLTISNKRKNATRFRVAFFFAFRCPALFCGLLPETQLSLCCRKWGQILTTFPHYQIFPLYELRHRGLLPL